MHVYICYVIIIHCVHYDTSWWFQPIGKILISQIGSFPQVGVKIKNV